MTKRIVGDAKPIGRRATRIDIQVIEDANRYHIVMQLLRNLDLPHGRCDPRKRRACTHCNAKEKLREMVDNYRGAPVRL